MEEQKLKSKEIRMNPNVEAKPQPAENQKLTYEQLNQACMELSQQNQQMQTYIKKLHQQMGEMNALLGTKRMDYLFKVIELHTKYEKWFDSDFVLKCAEEVQESLTIPEETEQEDNKEQN